MDYREKERQEYLPEKEFLIKFGVDAYNRKYGQKLKREFCRIKSFPPSYGFKYGYQIESNRSDDFVVIMLYFNLGNRTQEDIVRVELIQNLHIHNDLGDEVYVVTGEIDRWYKDACIYKFDWIGDEGYDYTAVMYMDRDIFQFMNGDLLSFMETDPEVGR